LENLAALLMFKTYNLTLQYNQYYPQFRITHKGIKHYLLKQEKINKIIMVSRLPIVYGLRFDT